MQNKIKFRLVINDSLYPAFLMILINTYQEHLSLEVEPVEPYTNLNSLYYANLLSTHHTQNFYKWDSSLIWWAMLKILDLISKALSVNFSCRFRKIRLVIYCTQSRSYFIYKYWDRDKIWWITEINLIFYMNENKIKLN